MNAIAFFDPYASSNSAKLEGQVTFHQCSIKDYVIVHISLKNFKPNSVHAIHVHEEGDLSKGCISLCAHFNPHNKLHGSYELYGQDRHVGDLKVGNIVADKNGIIDITFVDDLIDLYSYESIIGRSIVIHEKMDDLGRYRYDNDKRGKESAITGNAGGRIACAIIGRSSTDFHHT